MTPHTPMRRNRESVETLKIFITEPDTSNQPSTAGGKTNNSGTIVFNVPALDDVWATDKDFSVSTGASLSGEQTIELYPT